MNEKEINYKWQNILKKLNNKFEKINDISSILFLIGVQELGKVNKKFTKDEKLYLIHIATCKLLSKYGYYVLKGYDKDGWPQWQNTSKLPPLNKKEEEILLKQAIIDYLDPLL